MDDRTALRRTLIEFLEEQTDIRHERMNDDHDLVKDLGVDSVDLINLVIALERRFQIRIESDELRPIESVGPLLDLLQTKLAPPLRLAA